jgi:hypothetical protein
MIVCWRLRKHASAPQPQARSREVLQPPVLFQSHLTLPTKGSLTFASAPQAGCESRGGCGDFTN